MTARTRRPVPSSRTTDDARRLAESRTLLEDGLAILRSHVLQNVLEHASILACEPSSGFYTEAARAPARAGIRASLLEVLRQVDVLEESVAAVFDVSPRHEGMSRG